MKHSVKQKAAVIVRAGRHSTHAGWTAGGTPEFDLFAVAYEALPADLMQAAHRYLLLPGRKVAGWAELFARHPELLEEYEQIALIDDDIICSVNEINKSFALGRLHGLSLWQPSLSWNSHFTYGAALHNPHYTLRFTNFVEMMCPFFSTAYLRSALPLFGLGYETGIDLLWCHLQKDWKGAFAVLDAVQVQHSRPVGEKKSDQGFLTDYQDVIDEVLTRFGVIFRGPVAYAGITQKGRKISGRWPMAWRALTLLGAISQNPDPKWARKAVTDHIRHMLTRPVGLGAAPPKALAALLR